MTCVIFGAGNASENSFIKRKDDFVIAADAGFNTARKMGVEVDLLMGDFDSLGEPPKGAKCEIFPSKKDDTDMLLAVRRGLKMGYKSFIIFGGTGGRLDHTLANLQTLAFIASNGARGVLSGDNCTAVALKDGEILLPQRKNGYVSVFCAGDEARGVYLTGLKYPLTDAVLKKDMPLGVSNEFTDWSARVRVDCGTLYVLIDGGASEEEIRFLAG